MVIHPDRAVVHTRDGTGVKSSAVTWVVETFAEGGWTALNRTAPPTLRVRDIGDHHEVITSGTLEGGVNLTVSYRGLPVDVPESGPKITAYVENGQTFSYLRVGWRVDGVTTPKAQLEVRNGTSRTLVAAYADDSPFQDVVRADGAANSVVFLNANDEVSFGINWEDALTLHSETVFLSDGTDFQTTVYFGPFQLAAGEIAVIDPLIEGGGGGGDGGDGGTTCSAYVKGWVSLRDDAKLHRAKVMAGGKVTYTNNAGYYAILLPEGGYTVTASHTAAKSASQSVNIWEDSNGECQDVYASFGLALKNGGSINFHYRDAGETSTAVQAAFDRMVELNGRHVRTDFAWETFEPNGPSDHSLSFWSNYINWANARGLDVVVILSNPPGWASDLYYDGKDKDNPDPAKVNAFFGYWREYCREMAYHFGDRVYYYQLANEENHLIHSFVYTEDEPRLFQECHQGLREGEGVPYSVYRQVFFRTSVNAWADQGQLEWDDRMRWWLDQAGSYIDIAAVDHYPGTWCCGSDYKEWGPLEQLLTIVRDYGKWGAVMETGYSTYGPWSHLESDQRLFIHDAFVTIRDLIRPHNLNYPSHRIMLLNWYELVDNCSGCGGFKVNVEHHFGIYNDQWQKKEGWWELRYHLGVNYYI